MRKETNTCLTCLDNYGCMKHDLKPSIGQCSIKRPDHRLISLQRIAEAIRKRGIAYLRHPIHVTEDFLGSEDPFVVHKVSLPEGAKISGLDFLLGKDPFGNTIWTSHVNTEDLVKIAEMV